MRLATAAAGHLDVTGTAALGAPVPLDARWSWSGGDLEPLVDRFAPDAAALIPGGFVVAGEVAASGRLGGSLTAPTVSGEVRVRDLAVRPGGAAAGGPPGWRLSGEHPVARFAWTRAKPTIELEVPDTRLIVAVDPLDPVPVVLQASADLDSGERRRSGSDRLVVDAGSLGTARLEGDWQPTAAALARLAVRVDDLGGWLPLAAPVVGDSLRDASRLGTCDARAGGDERRHRVELRRSHRVAGAGLSAADGSRVMEGLEANALLEGIAGPGGGLTANVAATLGGFQVLWGTHYADFTDRRAVVDDRRESKLGRRRGGDGAARAAPPGRPGRTLRIAAGAPPVWEGSLTVTDIGGFWERYVGVPFQGTLGAAGSLRLEGGELRTRLSGTVGEVDDRDGGDAGWTGCRSPRWMTARAWRISRSNFRSTSVGPRTARWRRAEAHRGSLEFDRAAVGGGAAVGDRDRARRSRGLGDVGRRPPSPGLRGRGGARESSGSPSWHDRAAT